MSAYELPAWLDTRFIENALSRTAAPDKAELRDILDKSLALKSLTIQEATALMRVTDPEDVALMMKTADAVKQKVYGDRIVLTAPLHISNHCGSECLYCANRKSNTLIQRKYMTSPEMREAAGKLIRQGHKRIVLVSGQLPNADVEYLAEAISIMYTVFDGHGEVRPINRKIVGRPIQMIAAMVGITVPDNYKAIILKSQVTDASDILGEEIMAPVLRYTTYTRFEDAVDTAVINLEVHGGAGHSSSIWSNNQERINYAARLMPVGRFHINQPTRGKDNGLPITVAIGCGAWGGNSICENLQYYHLMDFTRVTVSVPHMHHFDPSDWDNFDICPRVDG